MEALSTVLFDMVRRVERACEEHGLVLSAMTAAERSAHRRIMSIPTPPPPDWLRPIDRMVLLISSLGAPHITDRWSLDGEAAGLALNYLQARRNGAPEDAEEEEKIVLFLREHGISLDWFFMGDVGGLLAHCARHSPRAQRLQAKAGANPVDDGNGEIEEAAGDA